MFSAAKPTLVVPSTVVPLLPGDTKPAAPSQPTSTPLRDIPLELFNLLFDNETEKITDEGRAEISAMIGEDGEDDFTLDNAVLMNARRSRTDKLIGSIIDDPTLGFPTSLGERWRSVLSSEQSFAANAQSLYRTEELVRSETAVLAKSWTQLFAAIKELKSPESSAGTTWSDIVDGVVSHELTELLALDAASGTQCGPVPQKVEGVSLIENAVRTAAELQRVLSVQSESESEMESDISTIHEYICSHTALKGKPGLKDVLLASLPSTVISLAYPDIAEQTPLQTAMQLAAVDRNPPEDDSYDAMVVRRAWMQNFSDQVFIGMSDADIPLSTLQLPEQPQKRMEPADGPERASALIGAGGMRLRSSSRLTIEQINNWINAGLNLQRSIANNSQRYANLIDPLAENIHLFVRVYANREQIDRNLESRRMQIREIIDIILRACRSSSIFKEWFSIAVSNELTRLAGDSTGDCSADDVMYVNSLFGFNDTHLMVNEITHIPAAIIPTSRRRVATRIRDFNHDENTAVDAIANGVMMHTPVSIGLWGYIHTLKMSMRNLLMDALFLSGPRVGFEVARSSGISELKKKIVASVSYATLRLQEMEGNVQDEDETIAPQASTAESGSWSIYGKFFRGFIQLIRMLPSKLSVPLVWDKTRRALASSGVSIGLAKTLLEIVDLIAFQSVFAEWTDALLVSTTFSVVLARNRRIRNVVLAAMSSAVIGNIAAAGGGFVQDSNFAMGASLKSDVVAACSNAFYYVPILISRMLMLPTLTYQKDIERKLSEMVAAGRITRKDRQTALRALIYSGRTDIDKQLVRLPERERQEIKLLAHDFASRSTFGRFRRAKGLYALRGIITTAQWTLITATTLRAIATSQGGHGVMARRALQDLEIVYNSFIESISRPDADSTHQITTEYTLDIAIALIAAAFRAFLVFFVQSPTEMSLIALGVKDPATQTVQPETGEEQVDVEQPAETAVSGWLHGWSVVDAAKAAIPALLYFSYKKMTR